MGGNTVVVVKILEVGYLGDRRSDNQAYLIYDLSNWSTPKDLTTNFQYTLIYEHFLKVSRDGFQKNIGYTNMDMSAKCNIPIAICVVCF